MQILKIDHKDFNIVIECNNIESIYYKAKEKHTEFENSTTYKISEGEITIFNFLKKSFEYLNNTKTHPIFFENKDYIIDITFKNKIDIINPYIYSKLIDVEDKFLYRPNLGLLSGIINFGNDLGHCIIILKYLKNGTFFEVQFEFEVFPTKLNYKTDFEKIIRDIEEEYPYLVLDYLKKTFSYYNNGIAPNSDLIWWQIFGNLYLELIKASKYILNKPKSRILTNDKFEKADRIKFWKPEIEEKYANNKLLPNKRYLLKNKSLSINITENRFFKYVVNQTFKRYKNLKSKIEKSYSDSISNNFKNELNKIEKELEIICANPLFKKIENYKGIKQESLILQKATGYNSINKFWIMLNSGLNFWEGIQKIELKNIAELYQIWCFLEIKKILQKIIGKDNPEEVKIAEIQIDNFLFKIEKGIKSKISFINKNGDLIDLFHDLSYDFSDLNNEKTYTVKQRPDIVLKLTKNDLIENYTQTYLFDAKYRLKSDIQFGLPDTPTEDSINQMHRYRDAIYYVNKEKNKPEKEIIGAYILFPGSGYIDDIKKSIYYKSIEKINIGAFPLRPNDDNNRLLLENHLTEIIGNNTEDIYKNITPHKEFTYENPNPYVLIGFIDQSNYNKSILENNNPYYIIEKNINAVFGYNKLKYFAPYIAGKGIKEYYEIISFELKSKTKINEKNLIKKLNQNEKYLVMKLGVKLNLKDNRFFDISDKKINEKNTIRYTKLQDIKKLKNNKIEVLKHIMD